MSDLSPTLRKDLIISQREMAEGTLFVIKEPTTGRFFQFQEPQYFIVHQLDGVTGFSTIQRRIKERFGTLLTEDDFQHFIDNLRKLSLLENIDSGAGNDRQAHQQGRVRGNLLYQRFKAFDPDQLFNRMIGKVRFCFTPFFVMLSAGCVVLGVAITITNGYEIGRATLNLFQLQGLVLAYMTVILITTAHEFAHGLTCKHFGGEVHEMGFMLLYFQPAFYCNVSDAWLFPEKSKRLWVTFSGAYFEVTLWALATVAWRVTEPFTTINHISLVVMASSGIKSLFNLNPLIKLDGYYLLSDYLEIPNLRGRAFAYLGTAVKGLWGFPVHAGKANTARERRIYLAYGFLAGSFSIFFLSFIALYFGSYLTDRYQGIGFIIISGLIAMVLHHPLKKVFEKFSTLFTFGRREIPPIKKPIKIGLLGVTLLAILFLLQLELTITGKFTALPIHNNDVRAQVEAIIEEVYVEEGDWVEQGDLIARLSNRQYLAELNKVKANIHEKEAKLRMLKAGPRKEEVELARKLVETERTRLQQARNRYEEMQRLLTQRLARRQVTIRTARERSRYAKKNMIRINELWEKKLISRREFELAEEQAVLRKREVLLAEALLRETVADKLGEFEKEVMVTGKELEEAESKLKVLLAGSRIEELEAIEAEISSQEAQLHYLEGQLQRVVVSSPHSGVITTPKMKQKIGQLVEPGDLIAKVHEQQIIIAKIAISELEIADVHLGQKVILKARAYPAKSFYGTVTSIAPAAVNDEEYTAGAKIIMVTSEIENTALLLKSQMTGNAKILSGKRRVFDLMTRRFVRYIRVEFWSWW